MKHIIHPSIPHSIRMSFSISNSATVPAWHKCTISEHVIENGDPLVICKKACKVAKHGASASATLEAVPTVEALNPKAVAATKRKTQVLLAFKQISTHLISNTIIYP